MVLEVGERSFSLAIATRLIATEESSMWLICYQRKEDFKTPFTLRSSANI
jgi:hypothetical protein